VTPRAETAAETLMQRVQPFIGVVAGELVAEDEVNAAMIRHWCEVLEDRNPAYTPAGAETVHGGQVAPPTMLQVWTMRGLALRGGPGSPNKPLMDVFDEAGFTSVVATDCEQDYVRYLRPGDRVTSTTTVESISEEKSTALGAGHFVTTLVEYRVGSGELVGTQRFRLLKFRPAPEPATTSGSAAPGGSTGGRATPGRPRPAVNEDTEFFWDGMNVGELRIQRCASCATLRHPPRPACGACGGLDSDHVVASGRGTVHSFVVHHYPAVPGFEPPFVVALIELEEGPRLVSNLTDVGPEDVAIGLPVEVAFTEVEPGFTLPLFRRRTA
jgi:3-oxo-4,17-pregnadiene-20-carboxyl-CoA hydratase alpha subunit